MSKGAKAILITIAVLFLVVVVGIVLLFTNLNKPKPSITADQFRNIMKGKDYTILDANDQFSQYDYIKQVYLAIDPNLNYQIEFYELSDEENAISFYNNNASIFQSSKGSASAETSVNGKNYSKYTLSSNGEYMVVSRINNTVIYIDADDTYRDEIKSELQELGY